MKTPRILLVSLLALVTAACVPNQGTSWPGLLALDYNGPDILLSHEGQMEIVDAATGEIEFLYNSEGERRVGEDGEPLAWTIDGRDAGGAQFYASPAFADDETLIVGSYDRRMFEVDLPTARIVNTDAPPLQGRGNIIGHVALADGLAYVGLNEEMVAIEAESLQPLWSAPADHNVWAQPLLLDGVAYYTSLDHFLYAVDADTGEPVWNAPIDLEGAAASTPTHFEGRLYVGSFGNKVFEISLTGEVLSTYETQDWVWGAPAIDDGVLYIGDLGGNVYALEANGLAELWLTRAAEGAIRMTPIVYDDKVIVGSRDETVYWLTRDEGSVVFDRDMEGEVLSDILLFEADPEAGIEEAQVVVSSLARRQLLVAFTVANGERLWTYGR